MFRQPGRDLGFFMRAKPFLRLLAAATFLTLWAGLVAAEPVLPLQSALPLDSLTLTPAIPFEKETAPAAELRVKQVFPTLLFVNDSGTLCQVVIVRIENASAGEAHAALDVFGPEADRHTFEEAVLTPGTHDVILLFPDNREPGTVEMTLFHGDRLQQRLALEWEPARQWKVYVVQTSHFDHGYTGVQERVMEKRDRILDDVLEYCALTDGWPEEAKFRWMVEASFCLSHYLETHPWREAELRERISDGRIEIGAKLCHMHSSTAGHEELVRNLYNSTVHLADRFDAEITTAVHNDVDGITWGSVAAWLGAGVRYFSLNPNPFYRGGNILYHTDMPQAYYWIGANERGILTWRSRIGYGEGRFLIEGLDCTIEELPRLLARYENPSFPYDAIHLTRTGLDETPFLDVHDNCYPRFEVCETIRQWNELFEYPRLISATSSQFFGYLEENFADEIPELRGDCPDWWADGVVTGAVEEGRARRLHHKLCEAEILASAVSVIDEETAYPHAALDRAWEWTLLFDEHTWGTIFPLFYPQGAIWWNKVADMDRAGAVCDEITARAAGKVARSVRGDGPGLLVFNPLSWDRTDVAIWGPPPDFPRSLLGSAHFRILDKAGDSVPYQMTADETGAAEVVFLAANVPSVGYTTYRIVPAEGPPSFQSGLTASRTYLESGHYRLTFSPEAGVTGLRDRVLGRELVVPGAPYRLNEFVSRNQGLFDSFDMRLRGRIEGCTVEETGPVFTSVVFDTADPLGPGAAITQEVRLYDGLRRVDFINRVEDFLNLTGQSRYFAFPFDVPGFEFRIDTPLAVMRPFHEQLPDFAKFYAVQHWVDASSAAEDFGVTWATAEGPMVELGEITKPSCWWAIVDPLYYDPGIYPYEPGLPHIYSEIMNNYHNTNFNYLQQGSDTWRYAVTSHAGGWDQPAVTRFGWGLASPLLVELFEADPAGGLPRRLSFFRVDKENVKILAVKAAEQGEGLIVRLFENEGRATQVEIEIPLLENMRAVLTDLAERAVRPLACAGNRVTLEIGAFDLATVRITGESVYASEREGTSAGGSGRCGCAAFGRIGNPPTDQIAAAVLIYLLPAVFIAIRLRRVGRYSRNKMR